MNKVKKSVQSGNVDIFKLFLKNDKKKDNNLTQADFGNLVLEIENKLT